MYSLPTRDEMQQLGEEILQASERNREAIAKASPEWERNRAVYDSAAGVHRPEASTRAEGWGLDLADRSEARDSWQAQMSESGDAMAPLSQPFQLLTRSQVSALRKVARSTKGRRRLQLLIGSLREAAI